MDGTLDKKNEIVIKLLHYFITEKNYNPVILQGVQNEIWLENMDEEYKIIRIVSNHIHNEEQFNFDIYKTKSVVKKIKKKTFTINMNVLSIFTDLADRVEFKPSKNMAFIKLEDEDDLNNKIVTNNFPDITKKLVSNEEGMKLFIKLTNDINKKNKETNEKVEDVFKPKKPVVTRVLIIINILIYVYMILTNYNSVLLQFATQRDLIRAGGYYRIITGAFLHGNIFHLLFNCYALYIIGSQIESFLGRWKYLFIYLFSAITGSLLSISFSSSLSVGASGAIFGLMGSLLYFGYHYRVYLGSVIKSQIIPLIVLNLAIGFLTTGIDNAAHIGGLIGGTLATIAVGVKYKSSKFEMVNGFIVSILFLLALIYFGIIY